MPLIYIVLTLIVAGVLMWLVNTYIPMAGGIKTLLNAVVVIVLAVCAAGLRALALRAELQGTYFATLMSVSQKLSSGSTFTVPSSSTPSLSCARPASSLMG